MGPPRFSVPLRIYERGNVDSGYKADSYISDIFIDTRQEEEEENTLDGALGPEIGSSVS